MLKSLALFVVAGLFEIGGGYLVWQWLREHRPWWVGLLGFVLLAAYGLLPTLQPASFGRTYATYGALFIILSLFWAWWAEGAVPDRYDLLGAAICLTGAAVIFLAPRP